MIRRDFDTKIFYQCDKRWTTKKHFLRLAGLSGPLKVWLGGPFSGYAILKLQMIMNYTSTLAPSIPISIYLVMLLNSHLTLVLARGVARGGGLAPNLIPSYASDPGPEF